MVELPFILFPSTQPSSDAGFSSSSDDDDGNENDSTSSSSALPPSPFSCVSSSQEGEAMMEVRWFWSPQELLSKKEDRAQCLLRELFESDRVDEIPVVRREGGKEGGRKGRRDAGRVRYPVVRREAGREGETRGGCGLRRRTGLSAYSEGCSSAFYPSLPPSLLSRPPNALLFIPLLFLPFSPSLLPSIPSIAIHQRPHSCCPSPFSRARQKGGLGRGSGGGGGVCLPAAVPLHARCLSASRPESHGARGRKEGREGGREGEKKGYARKINGP